MTIILDRYPIPDKGTFTISETVTIRISSDEAKRVVVRWLLDEVSYMLGAEEPVFVIGEQTGWQVPVVYSTPHVGRVAVVGNVMVDAQTGYILNPAGSRIILEEETKTWAAQLPPFHLHETPADYLADNAPPTRPPGWSSIELVFTDLADDKKSGVPEDELFGIWKGHEIAVSVDDYVRESRKGRSSA